MPSLSPAVKGGSRFHTKAHLAPEMRAHGQSLLQPLLEADLKNNSVRKHFKGDCPFSLVQKRIRAQKSMLFRKEK